MSGGPIDKTGGNTPNILFLAHDLTDPAISRRVAMLKAGGAKVVLAGFRRSDEKFTELCGCPVLDLGQTYNSAFIHRVASVLRVIFTARRYRDVFAGNTVILARNLEMLAIAARVRQIMPEKPVIVYELLDIHRLLLKKNPAGFVLRAIEAKLVSQCAAIITSSPAFIDHYLRRYAEAGLPIRLVENKLLDLDGHLPAPILERPPAPPWRIGWFGILRDRQSLLILQKLVRESQGRVEAIIRGRPAFDVMPDFNDIIAATPGMKFLGPYKNPEDLAAIYGDVHFVWAIDLYEEGLNSAWLLPNRIYEGGFYGAVPLAVSGVESGNFLFRLGVGITLKQPLTGNASLLFATLTPNSYKTFTQNMVNVARAKWAYNREDCRHLVEWVYGLQRFTMGG